MISQALDDQTGSGVPVQNDFAHRAGKPIDTNDSTKSVTVGGNGVDADADEAEPAFTSLLTLTEGAE